MRKLNGMLKPIQLIQKKAEKGKKKEIEWIGQIENKWQDDRLQCKHIILNINGIDILIKRQRWQDWLAIWLIFLGCIHFNISIHLSDE